MPPVDPKTLEVLGSNHLDKVMFQGKTGVQVTKSVYSFFTTYIQEQRQLAVMLAQMSTDEVSALKSLPFPDRMQGCLDCCINFFQQSKAMSDALMCMVNDMIRGVIGPMESFMEAQRQLNESTENMTAQIMNGKNANTAEVLLKQQQANEAINELNKANIKKKKDYDLKAQKAKTCILAYKEALRNANEATVSIATIEAPRSVNQVLDMERLRITSLGQVFEKYGKIQLDYAKNTEGIISHIRSFTAKFDELMTTDVNGFVASCLEDQARSSLLVAMSYNLNPITLVEETDEQTIGGMYNFSNVLEDIVSLEEKRVPALRKLHSFREGEMILPLVFDVLVRTLDVDEVLRTKGLFATTVNKQISLDILNQLECGACSLSKYSPLEISAALKTWFRQLSTPIISSEHEKGCLAIGKAASKNVDENSNSWEGVRKGLRLAVSKLPKIKIEVLRRYVVLLAKAVDVNKGTNGYLEQLAFSCAPCLFPIHTEEDPTKVGEFTGAAQHFLAAFIKIQLGEMANSNNNNHVDSEGKSVAPLSSSPAPPAPRDRLMSSQDPIKNTPPPSTPSRPTPGPPIVPKTNSNNNTPTASTTNMIPLPSPPPKRPSIAPDRPILSSTPSVSRVDIEALWEDSSKPTSTPTDPKKSDLFVSMPAQRSSQAQLSALWDDDEPKPPQKTEVINPLSPKPPEPKQSLEKIAADASPLSQSPNPRPPDVPKPMEQKPLSPDPKPPLDPKPSPPVESKPQQVDPRPPPEPKPPQPSSESSKPSLDVKPTPPSEPKTPNDLPKPTPPSEPKSSVDPPKPIPPSEPKTPTSQVTLPSSEPTPTPPPQPKAESPVSIVDSTPPNEPKSPQPAVLPGQSAKFPLPRTPVGRVEPKTISTGKSTIGVGDIVEVVAGAEGKYEGLKGGVLHEVNGEWEIFLESGVKVKFKPALLRKLEKPDVVVGDYLRVKTTQGERLGVVKFVGTTSFADGEWVGLELPTDAGKNDGSVKGQAYFQCLPNHGLFIQHVAILEHSKIPITPAASVAPAQEATPQSHADIRAKLALLGNLGKPPLPLPSPVSAAPSDPVLIEDEIELHEDLVHVKKVRAAGARRAPSKLVFSA